MHILTDITHPAHVHFFKSAIKIWRDKGHKVTITTRQKEMTTRLLENLGFDFIDLGPASSGLAGLMKELPRRDLKLARIILSQKPDVLAAIGGIFIAHAGFLTRTPSVVFYDTENARAQNILTYPLATAVITPKCYEAWAPRKKHIVYKGYHELAYTHPNYFKPDPSVLSIYGLKPGEDFIILRLVSWGATHDVLDRGITNVKEAVSRLSRFGRVLITSERNLGEEFSDYCIKASPELVHHLLYYAKLFIGESATMASESAMLGTPAVFISTSRRGYTNEQEKKYGLTYTFSSGETCQEEGLNKAVEILEDPESDNKWKKKQQKMLSDTIDVTCFIVDQVEAHAKINKG